MPFPPSFVKPDDPAVDPKTRRALLTVREALLLLLGALEDWLGLDRTRPPGHKK